MRSQWKEMDPVDDFVTQQTPGLKIYQKVWGGMQCAYHSLPRVLTSRRCWRHCRDGLCGVPHHAYVISGTLRVIYKDGSEDVCKAGDVCYWPAPHNFISEEGAEIIQFSGSGELAAQAAVIEGIMAKMAKK